MLLPAVTFALPKPKYPVATYNSTIISCVPWQLAATATSSQIHFVTMASHVVVIATDLRRTTIKVTPGTYLIDVLQEACKKLNLPADAYLVK